MNVPTGEPRQPEDGCGDDIRELFEQHNLRCTCQRAALFEALVQSKCHPTAEELYNIVRPQTDRLSLATVYNTLETLCQAGLARKLPTTNGCCRYDADLSDHYHVRFPETGEIRDVPVDLSRKLRDGLPRHVLDEVESTLGITIDDIHIQITARTGETNGISTGTEA
jgi:Fe2+ or Zn2+ uptake regulation protein